MIHYASPQFWENYEQLPKAVKVLADRVLSVLRDHPDHPDLRLTKVEDYYLLRVGFSHRAIGLKIDGGALWFWIGGFCPLEDAPRPVDD